MTIKDMGLFGEMDVVKADGELQREFVVPPFSTLDARAGYWQDRKRAWSRLGIKGEIGRDAAAIHCPSAASESALEDANYTSIFDPVLCELAYLWFSPPDGLVLDPFAGGSVRGIVAGKTGRRYVGLDLRQEQVDANEDQAREICGEADRCPEWICADGADAR